MRIRAWSLYAIGFYYVRVLQPSLHYELEQICKSEILRKLKQRFDAKIILTSDLGLADLEDQK